MMGVSTHSPSSVDLTERLLMTSPSSKPVALSRRAVLGAGGVGLAQTDHAGEGAGAEY